MILEIRTMRSADWEKYRDFRLQALRDEPDLFNGSFEIEKDLPENYWKGTIREADKMEKFWLLFAWENDVPIGMISAFKGTDEKLGHIVTVSCPYVSVKDGGKGVERKLISDIENDILKNEGVRKIRCFITVNQPEKIAMFQQAGFKIVGELSEEMRLATGGYINEYILEKSLIRA